ncbi:hypothetical protein Tco_0942525 [Tanacetum coccineum]
MLVFRSRVMTMVRAAFGFFLKLAFKFAGLAYLFHLSVRKIDPRGGTCDVHRPPILEKDMYESWKSRMELYMMNRQHERMILESVENGLLIWPTIEENGVTRPKKYYELSATGKQSSVVMLRQTNIILKVYHKRERECKLYDEFNKFAYKKGETLRDFYLRFHCTNMKWTSTINQSSTPLTITYLSNDYQSSVHHNVYSPPSSVPQLEYALIVNQQQQQPQFPQLDLGLTILVFKQGDDPIDAINHMMSFLSAIVTYRYPTTNNQLRNSSNSRQQATINDGRVTLQPVQGRQIYFGNGTNLAKVCDFSYGAQCSHLLSLSTQCLIEDEDFCQEVTIYLYFGLDESITISTVNTTPIDYAVINQLSQDFETRFVPQTELYAEQAFWSQNSMNSSDPTPSNRPTKVEVLKELPKVSMVNTSLKKLKHHLAGFDVVVKERTTATAITKGSWGFEHTKACFRDEIIPFAVEQHRLESKIFEVKMNQVLNEHERVLEQVINKDIVNIIMNSSVDNASVNVHECEKCLKLETELLNKKNFVEKEIYDKLFRSFITLEKHCISLEVDTQLNHEIFQRDNSVSNRSAPNFDQYFELNELKAQS